MNFNVIHWSYRDLREFPEELIVRNCEVEEIYLKENFIQFLPTWLFQFRQLRLIHMAGNLLKFIPEEIGQLENLEFLDMSRNQLLDLPNTLSKLKKLKHLNCSDNKIRSFFEGIGYMNLEFLDLSKNLIQVIPIELANCTTLSEIILNDNPFSQIPTKIFTLPLLVAFEAERCNLEYLPGIFNSQLSYLKIFNNSRLTHYPVIYEKFLRLHYDYWSENIVSADALMIFLPDECKRTVIPAGIRTIYNFNYRTPLTLFEQSLRGLHADRPYYNRVCSMLEDDWLPNMGYRLVQSGPNSLCGNKECLRPIFSECYFSLVKKNQSSSHIIFSSMFCSWDCSERWHTDYQNIYHKIAMVCSL